MSFDRRKPWGYIDKQELARARQANRAARQAVERILDERPTQGRLYVLLARIAHALGDNLAALHEMERIRRKGKGDT